MTARRASYSQFTPKFIYQLSGSTTRLHLQPLLIL